MDSHPGPNFQMQQLWILWRHEYDAQSRDVINDVTNRRTVDKQTPYIA